MRVLVVSNFILIGKSLIASLQALPLDESLDARLCQPGGIGEAARAWQPDVILIDATLDFAGAISTLGSLLGELPEANVVLLGREADEATVYEAIFRGAAGYLTGDASVETLASTLSGVAHGQLGLSRNASRRVIAQLRQAAQVRDTAFLSTAISALTPREQEVFDLVRRGMRSREIAKHLTIAEATVYKHIQNILDKLRVRSRMQAIFLSDPEKGGAPQPTR